MKLRLFEAFAGYGTSSFALNQLGINFELVGFSEVNKYAIQCFQQNHGGVNFGDITKIDWAQVPDFDLLTGGFPCQAFSTAGRQQGEADARGVLGLELTRALKEKQPKYFLFENVKGFMSKRFKETREKFVKSWEDAGYNVIYKVLNTKDFGIPQNRERIWFVGIRKDIIQFFKFPDTIELTLKLKDVLETNVEEKYFLKQIQVERLFKHFDNQKIKGNGFGEVPLNIFGISSCLNQRDFKEPKAIYFQGDVSGKSYKSQQDRVYNPNGLMCFLPNANPKNKLNIAVGCAVRAWPRTSSEDENRTQRLELNGTEQANSLTAVQKDSMIYDGQVRRLTPKECFRLQGFLNDEVNLDGLSDTQKYKLAGNGQSVNVVKLLLKELLK